MMFLDMIFLYVISILCFISGATKASSISHNNSINVRHKRSAVVIPTIEEMRVVVDKHNEFRASIGSEGEEPIPSNMRHMTWDDGLAYTSLRYVKKCIWKHSEYDERTTDTLNFINGENLWAGVGELAMNFDPAYGITRWFMEYRDYTFSNNSCIPGRKCGHYTQIVWAKSYKIGCAWTRCPKLVAPEKILEDAMYMVCQYAPGGNIEGEKLYKIGPRCSECNSFDTCPDDALCHNEKRDMVLRLQSNSGSIAGALSAIVIILASALGVGYYIYLHHKAKALQLLAAMRKTRRVSSVATLTDPKSSSSSVKENTMEPKTVQQIGDDVTNLTRGARLSSVQIETAGLTQ